MDSPFLRALADLAKAQGLDPYDYLRYRSSSRDVRYDYMGENRGNRMVGFNRGRAVELPADGQTYLVVILENLPPIHPGGGIEQLVLLGGDGRILDKFSCAHSGPTATEVRNPPDADGAQLIITGGGEKKLGPIRLQISVGRIRPLALLPGAQCPPRLDALLTEISAEAYSLMVPASRDWPPKEMKNLSAGEKAEAIGLLRACRSQLQPYDLKIYGIGPTTTGPYSMPPPLASIYVYKGKERCLGITVCTRDHVWISSLGVLEDPTLAARIVRLVRGEEEKVK